MKYTDIKQSGHNCLLDRLPKKKLTYDMVKRCKKKNGHCVVPELANRHRQTLRRVFIGPKRSVFPHQRHKPSTKPRNKSSESQAFEFRKGTLNQGWSRTISRLREETFPLIFWLTSNIGAVVLYQDRGFMCLINPEILHRTNECKALEKKQSVDHPKGKKGEEIVRFEVD